MSDSANGDVLAYHPGLDQSIVVPSDAMVHHRLSGWVLMSEWQEQQAQLEAAKAKDDEAKAPSRAAARSAASASDKDG